MTEFLPGGDRSGETAKTVLLIIEDEMLIRKGIHHAIPWDSYGIEVLEAVNGQAALRNITENRPDIILSDIQMPKMDGFSFIDTVRDIVPEARIIILTGYGSKEYMLQAIRAHVFDYLEKPVDKDIILQTVLRAQVDLKEEREARLNRQDAEKLNAALDLPVRICFLQGLFNGDQDDEFLQRLGQRLGMPLDDGKAYHLLLLRPARDAVWPLLTSLASVFHSDLFCYLIQMKLVGGFLDARYSREELLQFLRSIPGLSQLCVGPVLIAEGIVPLEEAPDAALYARQVFERFHLYPSATPLFFRDREKEQELPEPDLASAMDMMDRVLYRIEKGEMEDAVEHCMDYLALLEKADIDSRNYYGLVQMLLFRVAHKLNRDEWLGMLLDFCNSAPSAAVIGQKMRAIMTDEKMGATSENQLIRKGLQYIKEHFDERINVSQVAAALYLSPGYFGRLFKREMHMNFNTYLLQVRMEEAKRLLCETNQKNYEIARSVGFAGYKLFATSFRNYTGMSAGDYRSMYRNAPVSERK